MLNTLIAPSHIGNNEGVSRPVPQLLLPRHLHLPVRAEDQIFKGFVCQLCVREQNAILHSDSRGKIACKMLVSVNITKNHSMSTKSAPEHTTPRNVPRKVLMGVSPSFNRNLYHACVSLALSAAA